MNISSKTGYPDPCSDLRRTTRGPRASRLLPARPLPASVPADRRHTPRGTHDPPRRPDRGLGLLFIVAPLILVGVGLTLAFGLAAGVIGAIVLVFGLLWIGGGVGLLHLRGWAWWL